MIQIISNLFTETTLLDAPPILSFRNLPKKKERAAPGGRKKKALVRVGDTRSKRGSPPPECWHTLCAQVSAAAMVYRSQLSEARPGGSVDSETREPRMGAG